MILSEVQVAVVADLKLFIPNVCCLACLIHSLPTAASAAADCRYFWNKYTPLGKAGINWIPTLGTWLQNNKLSYNDGRSVSFYHALSALSNALINKENTTVAQAVDVMVHAVNGTYQGVTAAATAAVVAKSQAYVQPSNAVTRANYEYNKANGAHPEAANTYGVFKGNQSIGVTVNHGADGAKPLSGVQAIVNRAFLHESNGGKSHTFRIGLPQAVGGGNHTIKLGK